MRWKLEQIYSRPDSLAFESDLTLAKKMVNNIKQEIYVLMKEAEYSLNTALIPAPIRARVNKVLVSLNETSALATKLRTFISLTLMINNANIEAKAYLGLVEELCADVDNQKADMVSLYKLYPVLFQNSNLRKDYKGFFHYLERLATVDSDVVKAVNMMSLTGGKAWHLLHNTNLDRVQEEVGISIGQLSNTIRTGSYEEAMAASVTVRNIAEKAADVSLVAMNNIKGEFSTITRLYKKTTPLAYTLEENQITSKLFDNYIECAHKIGKRVINAYKEMTGKSRFNSFEVQRSENMDISFDYSECIRFMRSCYTDKSPRMISLIDKAVKRNLIDNEPRLGKRSGAVMSALYATKESYILSNDTGSLRGLRSLAHEFGHAYHYDCMYKYPALETNSPPVISECISKLSEIIMMNHLRENKLVAESVLKEMWLKDIITTMCHVLSRYYFEDSFFEMRICSPLTMRQTCDIMKESVHKAFHQSLIDIAEDEYSWVIKPHYYYVNRPYYNFPYIVGMISAMLIFEKITMKAISYEELETVLAETGRLDNYECFLSAFGIVASDVIKFDFAF